MAPRMPGMDDFDLDKHLDKMTKCLDDKFDLLDNALAELDKTAAKLGQRALASVDDLKREVEKRAKTKGLFEYKSDVSLERTMKKLRGLYIAACVCVAAILTGMVFYMTLNSQGERESVDSAKTETQVERLITPDEASEVKKPMLREIE